VDPDAVTTNIVVLDTGDRPAAPLAAAARARGVVMSALCPRTLRLVTHLDVDDDDVQLACDVLGEVLAA
jgi:threonine aldolase